MPRDADFDKLIYGDAGPPKKPGASTSAQPEDTDPTAMAPRPETLGAKVGQGVVQGALLDPIEAIGEGFERPEDPFPVPQGLRDWANRWRKNVEGSPEAQVARFGGSVLTGLGLEAGLARAGVTSLPWLARTAIGATEGMMSRPAGSPQELGAQALGGGIGGTIAGRSASNLRNLAASRYAAEQRAVSTAGRAGQTSAEQKYQALNLERTFNLKKPTAAARAQAGQDYATASRAAEAARMEAKIASDAIKLNPDMPYTFWQVIGTLRHDNKIKILSEIGKRIPPFAMGSGAGIVAQPGEQ